MTNQQLIVLAVIGFGFAASLAGAFILAYLLAVDLLSRASESQHGQPARAFHDGPTPPRRTVTPGDSLAGASTARAFPLGAHGSHDMPAPPRGHLTSITNCGVREVGAGELPHQMWTGRLR